MSDRQTFLKDKPYGFVPLIEKCEQKRGLKQNTFEADAYSGKLKLELIVQSPLHIGSSHSLCNDNGKIENLTMRRNGRAVLPGSSIKGVVRGIAEAVSYSCAVKLPDYRVRELAGALPARNRSSCNSIKFMCPACSIFGMATKADKYKSKVEFGEFTCIGQEKMIIKEIPQLESPFKNYPKEHDIFHNKGNYGNERLYYCMACSMGDCSTCQKQEYFERIKEAGGNRAMMFRGRKFYRSGIDGETETAGTEHAKRSRYEMLDKGSRLSGEIIFQNLKRVELELLAYALNVNNQFQMKLGYGKPLGFGEVTVKLTGVEDLMGRYLKNKCLATDKVRQMAADYKENALPDIREAIRCLEQIMG